MKIKFEGVVILSKDTPFKESECDYLLDLIGQEDLSGVIDSEELFMLVSNLFGESRNLKNFIKDSKIDDNEIHQFVKRVDEISSASRISIESVSTMNDSNEYPEFSHETDGRYYSTASGTITINGLSHEEIGTIRNKCNQLSINIGLAYLKEL